MSAEPYTENQLVAQLSVELFAGFCWSTVSGGGEADTLFREAEGKMGLVWRLRAALGRSDPPLSSGSITTAMDELTQAPSAMRLKVANGHIYRLHKVGVLVSVENLVNGLQQAERVQAVGWGKRINNVFSSLAKFAFLARSTRVARIGVVSSLNFYTSRGGPS